MQNLLQDLRDLLAQDSRLIAKDGALLKPGHRIGPQTRARPAAPAAHPRAHQAALFL